MICKSCGAENTETAKFCGKCGSLLSDTNTSERVFPSESFSEALNDNSNAAEEPKKKSKRLPVLIVCIAAAVVVVLLLIWHFGQSRVYKYSSCSVDASNMSDDEFVNFFGGPFAEAIINELLRDTYIEIHANNTVTILVPNTGYLTVGLNELSINSSELSFSTDEDFTYVYMEDITLIFRRASDAEVETYENLLETAPEITEDTFDSIFGLTDGGTTNNIPTQK